METAPEPFENMDLESLVHFLTEQLDESARSYLLTKGIDAASTKRFELGAEPHLIGFVPKQPGPSALSGRITIPVRDASKKVIDIVGFAPDDRQPKFKSLTNRSDAVFGAHLCSDSASVVLCDGVFAAMTLLAANLPAVAIPECFSFGEQHTAFFAGKQIFLAFSQDELGRREMLRVAQFLRPVAAHVYAVAFPHGIKNVEELFEKAEEPVALLQTLLQQAVHASLSGGLPPDAQYLEAFYEEVTQERTQKSTGISTGLPILDIALGGGLFPGLYVISSAIGGGKTVLLRQLCDAIAEQGVPVIHFSYGPTAYQLWATSMARRLQVPIHDVLSGNVPDTQLRDANEAYREIAKRIWTIECMPDTTISVIAETIEQVVRSVEAVPFLILDPVERLFPDGADHERNLPPQERLEWAVYQMHHLARQLGSVALIAAYTQEYVAHFDPVIATADVYLHLTWEEESDEWRTGHALIAKNRHGEEGRCGVRYNKRTLTYFA